MNHYDAVTYAEDNNLSYMPYLGYGKVADGLYKGRGEGFSIWENSLTGTYHLFDANTNAAAIFTSAEDLMEFDNTTKDGVLDEILNVLGFVNDGADATAKSRAVAGTAMMTSSGRAIGNFTGPIGVTLGALQIANGIRKDKMTYGYNAKKATTGVVGGLAGAWLGFQAGVTVGAETGFTVGLAFEGVGALPGALVGAIVGGFSGAWGGAYGGSKFGESLIKRW